MRIFLALVTTFFLFAFVRNKEVVNTKITVPPGTSFIKEGLYMDNYEVSNMAWQEFIAWVQKYDEDTAKYKQLQPDATVWYALKVDAERYVNSYFSSNAFASYPVVGISYEQAKAFCEWRTERVNEILQKTPGSAFKRVEYRLPTESEWEFAAAGKLDTTKYPYGSEQTKQKLKNKDVVRMFNCVYPEKDSLDDSQSSIMPVNFGKPNQYGMYNMIGNAAEMVTEKGLAKGGFYDLPLEYCKIKEQSAYKFPNRYLGFRCVCTVDNNFSSKQQKETFKKEKAEQSKKDKKKKNAGFEQDQ
ncbi:MAG: SUMF1/EgtB/PvdO family nonheme iron enzyme [Bacteroidetes bacterium]|nr:SUMF1/EgtB/PvdO family nonheme iron enzyme [Bacteroidota bacterium]MBS1669902.1 SUMF1/EgtB/PvdO family nonheme iron enzyme [Bacteroidota bacterium]